MNTLYIIRGLPGAGKSTLARQIAEDYCEADMYFMKGDEYIYDKDKIALAHEFCQNYIASSMRLGNFINRQDKKIAVANTFVKRWEMEPYFKMAFDNGYRAVEITLSGKLYENTHNVPAEVIQRMKEGWEK